MRHMREARWLARPNGVEIAIAQQVAALLAPSISAEPASAAPGDITTIVGGGSSGLGDGGPATSAMLGDPWGLARSGGSLYISDSST